MRRLCERKWGEGGGPAMTHNVICLWPVMLSETCDASYVWPIIPALQRGNQGVLKKDWASGQTGRDKGREGALLLNSQFQKCVDCRRSFWFFIQQMHTWCLSCAVSGPKRVTVIASSPPGSYCHCFTWAPDRRASCLQPQRAGVRGGAFAISTSETVSRDIHTHFSNPPGLITALPRFSADVEALGLLT